MKIRRVNLKTIFTKTIIYRLFIVFVQAFFTYLYLRNIQKCFQISITWNIANCCLYYIYEYLFSKKYDTIIQTKGMVIWFTGLSGAGKTTLADYITDELLIKGKRVQQLDGDIMRKGLSKDLGFSLEDRNTNIKRAGDIAKLLYQNNVIVICSFISPIRSIREEIRKKIDNFIEVWVACDLDVCIMRDVKGMYAKALKGEIKDFTGISSPYEIPINPEIVVNTDTESVEQSAQKIIDYLKKKKLI